MTVVPFTPRVGGRRHRVEMPPATAVAAEFAAPAGGRGRFAGWYRLEACERTSRGLEALGVFTGTLGDADGRRLAVAARRTRVPATAGHAETGPWVALAPVQADLAGFLLSFPAVMVLLRGTAWDGVPGTDPVPRAEPALRTGPPVPGPRTSGS